MEMPKVREIAIKIPDGCSTQHKKVDGNNTPRLGMNCKSGNLTEIPHDFLTAWKDEQKCPNCLPIRICRHSVHKLQKRLGSGKLREEILST